VSGVSAAYRDNVFEVGVEMASNYIIKMTLRIAHIDQQGEVLKKTEVNNEILPKA